MLHRGIVVPLAALTLTLGATALTATPALADYPAGTATVTVFMTTIAARGAAVDVDFGVTCPAGATGSTSVTITETYAGLIATGTAIAPLTCDAMGDLLLQRVTADVSGAPFAKGRATLTLRVTGCDDIEGCFTTPIDQKIKITG